MARVTHAAPHLPLAEVKHRMRTGQNVLARQCWLIIYNAMPRATSSRRDCAALWRIQYTGCAAPGPDRSSERGRPFF